MSILHKVSRVLDTTLAYPEICYQTLIMKMFELEGLSVRKEVVCNYFVNKIRFGHGRIDLLVTTKDKIFIIELKANTRKKSQAIFQLKRYLTHYKSFKTVHGILAMYNTNKPCIIIKLTAVKKVED